MMSEYVRIALAWIITGGAVVGVSIATRWLLLRDLHTYTPDSIYPADCDAAAPVPQVASVVSPIGRFDEAHAVTARIECPTCGAHWLMQRQFTP